MKQTSSIGLFKFLKDAWYIAHERARVHRALRLLSRQQWSVEFLTALLHKAANCYKQQLEMRIEGPGGVAIIVKTTETSSSSRYTDDNVFNHLDDEVRVNQFLSMMENTRNGAR